MQPPQPSYASFPCPSCNYAISATMPAGMVFPCPMCQAQITAPASSGPTAEQAAQYQAWAAQNVNTAAALTDAQAPNRDPRRANYSSTSAQVLVRTREGAFYVVDSHVDQSEKWCLRAQDSTTGQLMWETPRQFHFDTCPGTQQLGCRNGLIYLVVYETMWCLDASSGKIYWQCQLPGQVMTHEDLRRGDEIALHLAGPAIVMHLRDRGRDEHAVGINGQNGPLLWHRQETEGFYVQPTPAGTVLLKFHDGFELLDAATGATRATVRGDFGESMPRFNRLRHGGIAGPRKIWTATIIATVVLVLWQGYGMARYAESVELIANPGVLSRLVVVLTLVAGVCLLLTAAAAINRSARVLTIPVVSAV